MSYVTLFKNLFFNKKLTTILRLNDKPEEALVVIGQKQQQQNLNKISFDNCFYNQKFSLPRDVIEFLFNTKNGKTYSKLIKICKYFYSKNRKNVLNKLSINCCKPDPYDKKATTCKTYLANSTTSPSNIWITDKACLNLHEQGEIVSKIIPKIYRCDAHFIYFGRGTMTEKELDFFINPKMVKFLYMDFMEILDFDGIELNMTRIIEKVPNALYLGFCKNMHDQSQPENLAYISMNSKVKIFKVDRAKDTFDLEDLINFAQKNFAKNSYILLHFYEKNEQKLKESNQLFNEIIKNSDDGRKCEINFLCYCSGQKENIFTWFQNKLNSFSIQTDLLKQEYYPY